MRAYLFKTCADSVMVFFNVLCRLTIVIKIIPVNIIVHYNISFQHKAEIVELYLC